VDRHPTLALTSLYLQSSVLHWLSTLPASFILCDRLHWLPVEERIQYKLCLLLYKAQCGRAPQYLVDFCPPVSAVTVSGRSRLRSSMRGDLILSGLRQILENILLPWLHQWHGTGCQKRSGIFSHCNCLSLVSRLTCSAALLDTGLTADI